MNTVLELLTVLHAAKTGAMWGGGSVCPSVPVFSPVYILLLVEFAAKHIPRFHVFAVWPSYCRISVRLLLYLICLVWSGSYKVEDWSSAHDQVDCAVYGWTRDRINPRMRSLSMILWDCIDGLRVGRIAFPSDVDLRKHWAQSACHTRFTLIKLIDWNWKSETAILISGDDIHESVHSRKWFWTWCIGWREIADDRCLNARHVTIPIACYYCSLNLAGRHWRSPPTSQRPDSCIWNSVSCQFDVCYSSRFLLFDRDFCTPVLPCVVMPAFFGSAVCPHKDLEWSSKIDTSTWSLKLSANVSWQLALMPFCIQE